MRTCGRSIPEYNKKAGAFPKWEKRQPFVLPDQKKRSEMIHQSPGRLIWLSSLYSVRSITFLLLQRHHGQAVDGQTHSSGPQCQKGENSRLIHENIPFSRSNSTFAKFPAPRSLYKEIRVDNINVFAPLCISGPVCPFCYGYVSAGQMIAGNSWKIKKHPYHQKAVRVLYQISSGFQQAQRFTLKAAMPG